MYFNAPRLQLRVLIKNNFLGGGHAPKPSLASSRLCCSTKFQFLLAKPNPMPV